MSNLKTLNIPGHAYFVTTKVAGGLRLFIDDTYCQVIMDNFNFYRKVKCFKLLGYVIMPTHLHYIILPVGQYTISQILMHFKEFTSKQIIKQLKDDSVFREARAPRPGREVYRDAQSRRGRLDFSVERGRLDFSVGIQDPANPPTQYLQIFQNAAQNISNQNYKVWMSRNWIENVYSQKFIHQKLNYIHNNPVRAGLVDNADDYTYSSARNYIQGDHLDLFSPRS